MVICGRILILFFLFAVLNACSDSSQSLRKGQLIAHSVVFQEGLSLNVTSDSLSDPILWIRGNNVVVDFNGAILEGTDQPNQPDTFKGLGIKVEQGHNITIKNLTVRGYKIALLAEGVDSLQLINCDFSYNYRPRLYSLRERESLADWLSFHNNEADEWLQFGAGAYLKNCDHALVKDLKVTNGMNGLLLTQCDSGLIYNNTLHFNSGLGIGMYRSSHNRVMHNQLDWNVRGYSHGIYQRGQDSAGILCYEQSSNNTFAFNSATHSGDGFFLWAGQSTMDTGNGGCNDNLIFENDFSHAPTNGIEVTFSRNMLVGNKMDECRYGVWGGYSWETLIAYNDISNCDNGIAIEHGQQNHINSNRIVNTKKGIQLWERAQQPEGWGYAQARDVRSRDYEIAGNRIEKAEIALDIRNTAPIIFERNMFLECLTIFSEPAKVSWDGKSLSTYTQPQQYQVWEAGNARTNIIVEGSALEAAHSADWAPIIIGSDYPERLVDGRNAALPEDHPRGRQFILMNEWGPYNFEYPSVWLRETADDHYTLLLLGPKEGNWKLIGGEGFLSTNQKTGAFPATLTAKADTSAVLQQLSFEYIGPAYTNQFGENIPKGKASPFTFSRLNYEWNWEVKWYAYPEEADPISNYQAFEAIKTKTPLHGATTSELAYRWWGAPAEGIPADRFATFASSTFEVPKGSYQMQVTSDDGVRVFLDGKVVLEHWNVHEPAVDLVVLDLDGKHTLEIEHFDAGGLATLDVWLSKAQ